MSTLTPLSQLLISLCLILVGQHQRPLFIQGTTIHLMKIHSFSVLTLALTGGASAALNPYDQCGGSGYGGDIVCPAKHTCVVINSYYSACVDTQYYPPVYHSTASQYTDPGYHPPGYTSNPYKHYTAAPPGHYTTPTYQQPPSYTSDPNDPYNTYYTSVPYKPSYVSDAHKPCTTDPYKPPPPYYTPPPYHSSPPVYHPSPPVCYSSPLPYLSNLLYSYTSDPYIPSYTQNPHQPSTYTLTSAYNPYPANPSPYYSSHSPHLHSSPPPYQTPPPCYSSPPPYHPDPLYANCRDPYRPCREDPYGTYSPDPYQAYTTNLYNPYTTNQYMTYVKRLTPSPPPYRNCPDPYKLCSSDRPYPTYPHRSYTIDPYGPTTTEYKPYTTDPYVPPPGYTSNGSCYCNCETSKYPPPPGYTTNPYQPGYTSEPEAAYSDDPYRYNSYSPNPYQETTPSTCDSSYPTGYTQYGQCLCTCKPGTGDGPGGNNPGPSDGTTTESPGETETIPPTGTGTTVPPTGVDTTTPLITLLTDSESPSPTSSQGGTGTTASETPSPSSSGSGFTPVVGAPGLQVRRPIEELQATYPDEYNMFILALAALQAQDESADLSYYQISGIHGRPFIPWQYPVDPQTQNPTRGYCTHGTALFATWHRPYLVLIEQAIYAHAIRIAAEFTGPEAQKYQEAAQKVRMPYWDWSSQVTKSKLPLAITEPQVTVVEPDAGGAATTRSIDNPFFSYRFTNDQYRETYFVGVFQTLDSTRRQPDGSFNSRNSVAEQQMMNTYDSRRANTLNLFSIPNFQEFASTASNGASPPSNWISVEAIHNTIHSHLGGPNGHMSYVDVAAFDPVFWLHHCNVDRLTVMYQAVRPDEFVQPGPASSTFGRIAGPGDVDDVNTPLRPFRHPDGREWTSQDISSAIAIFDYGYSYPEIPADFQSRPGSELTDYVIAKINELYRPNLNNTGGDGTDSSSPNPRSVSARAGPSKSRREYIAHIQLDQGELIGLISVLIFIGDVPANPAEWQAHPNHVGDCSSFGEESSTTSHIIRGSVPLTDAVVAKRLDLDPAISVPYFRKNLKWVIQLDGQPVPVTNLKSLKVGVSSSIVEYPESYGRLPTWGKEETHYDVTFMRDGGLQYADTGLLTSEPAPVVISNATISQGGPGLRYARLKL